jgi:hypothetical protein
MTNMTVNTEHELMQRLVDPERCGWSNQAAQAVLQLHFSSEDRVRASDLADRANQGLLSEADQREMESYLRLGTFIDLMQSKARLFLREQKAA